MVAARHFINADLQSGSQMDITRQKNDDHWMNNGHRFLLITWHCGTSHNSILRYLTFCVVGLAKHLSLCVRRWKTCTNLLSACTK